MVFVTFGIAVFLFWMLGYPEALCYQEQNQLFLWSGDYFVHDLSVAGGLADYLSEFLVQFYYLPALGAAILGGVFAAFYALTYLVAQGYAKQSLRWYWVAACMIPSLWLLAVMGDIDVLLSFPVALIISLFTTWLMNEATRKWGARCLVFEGVLLPLLFWLIGGAVTWLYAILRIVFVWRWVQKSALLLLGLPYLLGAQLVVYNNILSQYPLSSVLVGINYYRVPMAFPGHKYGYDKELYALLKMNAQVRDGKWQELIQDAEKYQPQNFFASNCVNLALEETRQLADRMFTFYQSGPNALLAPRERDNMSMYPTMEVFWQLGLVNSSLRYATDLQASILNGRQSGRLLKRMTECQIVNGKYSVAQKNLDILKQSLFYHDWAVKAEAMLGNDVAISHDPDLGRVRRFRYQKDMIYSYAEIDKMMGLLFINNPDNKMALDYFMGQMLLNVNTQGVMQYMGWVQQYGGYQQMPFGYQDAVRCIQNHGNVPGSAYDAYVRMMMTRQQQEGGKQ